MDFIHCFKVPEGLQKHKMYIQKVKARASEKIWGFYTLFKGARASSKTTNVLQYSKSEIARQREMDFTHNLRCQRAILGFYILFKVPEGLQKHKMYIKKVKARVSDNF